MTEPGNPYRPLAPDFLSELFHDPLDPGYAAAAARRRAAAGADGGEPPRRRAPRAVMVVAVLVVGLLLAVAYQQVVAEEPTRTQVRADLEEQIRNREAENDQLQARVDELRDEVAELRDQQLGDPVTARELRELEAATGLGRVHGDGVVVRLDDGPADIDPSTGEPVLDPQARILYRDLQQIANALWAAGAEAVAINDQRLTATSTIRSASGAILIDRAPIAGPYEVVAVGADELPTRFAGSEAAQLMELLVNEFGIEYEVRPAADLTLPAATEPQLLHATPLTDS